MSPGLIAHHFGSMNGLRRACDHHVAGVIRQLKVTSIEHGAVANPLDAAKRSRMCGAVGLQ